MAQLSGAAAEEMEKIEVLTLVRADVLRALASAQLNVASTHARKKGIQVVGALERILAEGKEVTHAVARAGGGVDRVECIEFLDVYAFGRKTPRIGRWYNHRGPQSFKGELRRHLFTGIGEDVDMVNSQPVLLLQLGAELAYPGALAMLQQYVDEREAWLERVHSERKEAKSLFLSVLFGGSANTWARNHPESNLSVEVRAQLAQLEQEIAAFATWFNSTEMAEDIRARCEPEPGITERKMHFRLMSVALQDMERRCLEAALKALLRGGGRVFCIIHDGAIASFGLGNMPGNQEDPPGPISGAETIEWRGEAIGYGVAAFDCDDLALAVQQETGYCVDFAVKSLEPTMSLEALREALKLQTTPAPAYPSGPGGPDGTPPPLRALGDDDDDMGTGGGGGGGGGTPLLGSFAMEEVKNCDMEAMEHFVWTYKDQIGWCAEGIIYHYGRSELLDDEGGILRKGYDATRAGVWHQGLPPHEWWVELFPNTVYSQCGIKKLRMSSLLKAYQSTAPRLGAWEQYPQHEFPVLSGMLHLLTGEIRPFEPSDRCTRKLDFDPPEAWMNPEGPPEDLGDELSNETMVEFRADLTRMYAGDPELAEALEQRFAYFFFERGNRLKMIINLVGTKGNNGKSSAGNKLKAMGGPKFVGSLDASTLSKRTAAGAPNSGLANARKLNVAICEEGGIHDKLSAALIKEVTGNTGLAVRDLNQRLPADGTNNMGIICMSNAAMTFDHPDSATDARMVRVELPSRFFKTAEEKELAIKELPVIEQMNAEKTMHLRDDTFDTRCATLPYRMLYFVFLVGRYQRMWTLQGGIPTPVPEDYLYQADEATLSGNSLEAIVEELFEITGDHTQKLSVKQFIAHINASRPKFIVNDVALGRHIARLVKISGGSLLKTGERLAHYSGITKKQDENSYSMPNAGFY